VVDIVEWTWTVIAAVGVGVSCWALVDGYIDRRILRRAGVNSDQALIVTVNLRGAQASLLLHAFFFVLGVMALLRANPPLSVAYVVLAFGYIAIAASNVRAVALNQWDRVRLRRSFR
jgi:hypothetical protein